MSDIADLYEALGGAFHDPSLLRQALVHSSYVNENPVAVSGHNERLEFLGDAVLGLVVAGELYRAYPDLAEGEMTRLRAALVSRDALARVAQSIRLGDFLYMGKGEEATGGRNKSTNLAGALEAVIAAVYLDGGIVAAEDLVKKLFASERQKLASPGTGIDYKTRLQEFIQAKYQRAPVYHLAAEVGPDHAKRFTIEVSLNGEVLGIGSGKSKKLAETEAARAALEKLGAGFT